MEHLVEVTSKQLRMSETVLKFATGEEIAQLRKICGDIAVRIKTARKETK